MPSVNIENIGIVNFPDSMSLQDIQRAIRDDIIPNFRRQQPVAQTEPVAPQQAPVPEGSGSSFARGIDEMQGGLYSAVEGLGRATGFQGVERFGREGRVRNIQEAEASLPSSQQMSFERASGVGENIRAAGQALGGSLPSSALPMGGALAGAAMGAPLGPVGAGIGAILGGAAGAFPGLYGSNRARQIETSGEVQSEGRAAAAAIPQALAEGVVDRITLGLGRILGVGGDVVGRELLPRIARGVGVGAVSEVPSEVFQQAMERAQAGLDVLSPEAMAEYREAATAAAVVGSTMGGTFAGALGPRPQPTEQDRQQAELRGAIEEVVGAREPVAEEVAAGAPVQEQEITPERISQAIERAQERLDGLTGTLNNARVRLAEATTGDDVDPAEVNAIKREIKDISGQVREQKSNISALNRILPRPNAAGELFKVRAGAAPAAAPVVEPAPAIVPVEPTTTQEGLTEAQAPANMMPQGLSRQGQRDWLLQQRAEEARAAIPSAPPVAPVEVAPVAEETVAPAPTEQVPEQVAATQPAGTEQVSTQIPPPQAGQLSARRVGEQAQEQGEIQGEEISPSIEKSRGIIQNFLTDLRGRGPQGESLATGLEEALADRRFNANQVYAAFTIDNAILKSMPKGADYKFKFVDDLVATDADAARASGANVGDRVQGRLNPATESIPAFIEISLAEDMLPILRETAAHEAFHVLQNYFGAYDRGFNALLAKSFKQDMTIDQLDPSIKRRLQGLKAPGLDQSYFAVLKSGLGDNPLSVREAQAYAFGALTDAALRGQKVTGLTAPFQRYVNFLRDTFTRLRSGLRGDGYQTAADLLAGAGARAEGFTQEAPQTGGQEYSGRGVQDQTNTEAFKRWFKDSKVVDADGKPLVVYHGTRTGGFNEFKPNFRKGEQLGFGMHFASSRDFAQRYAEDDTVARRGKSPQVYDTYLSIQNPLNANSIVYEGTKEFDLASRLAGSKLFTQKSEDGRRAAFMQNAIDSTSPQRAEKLIKEAGYDGVFYRARLGQRTPYGATYSGESESFIVFEPQQIKSATGNRGTFSESEKRIDYSARRPPGAAARATGNVAGLPQFGQRVPASTPASVNAADLQVQYDILPRYISNKLGRFVEKPKVERFFAVMQDKMLPAGRMIDDIQKAGGSVLVAIDAYLKEDLLQGKVADMLEKRNKNLYGKLTETLSQSGISLQDFENYIYARHAKERNDYIASINPNMPDGGSGLTNQQAKEFMDEFQQQGKLTKMQGLARLFDNIIADTNKLRVDSGLTPDFSRVTRAEDGRPLPNYQNYAPLRGFADESVDADETVQEFRPKTGKALGARGREDKRALGRERKAGDIIAHAIMQNTQAVIRSESNKVGQAFLEMIRSNPNQSKDLAEVIAKAPLKKTIVNGVVKLVPDINYKNAPDILVVKEGGKEVAIRIYDENVARAMNGASSLSPASKNMLVQGMAILNRYLAKINTAYNPEFLITNFVRDLQTFGVNVQQYDIDGIAKDSVRDLKSALAGVHDSVRNTNLNPQMKRSYERFKELGGTTEMYGFTNIESQIEEVNKVMASVGTQAKSWKDMAKAVTPVIKLIEDYNTIVENGIRTSLFKNLVDRGINEERAAQLAKNVTVNFSKGGEQRVLMNSLYLFYNASLQGTMAMVNALGRSPKVRKIVAGVVVAGVLQDVMNSMLSDVDDDEKKLYDKIPDYILKNRFVMMDPFNLTERGYFSFPMPYGFNAFFNMGREMSKASRGESSPMKAAGNILGTFVDSFNPIGGSENFFNFMAPTILDPAVDVIRNRDFSGRPIVPERGSFGVQAPESQKYWNNTFAPYVGISNFLNSLTGGTSVIPGAVDISPNMIQYVVNYATGGVGKFAERTFNTATTTIPGALRGDLEELDVKGVPFLRSLYGSVTTREDMTTYMERMEEVLRIRKEISDASQSGQPERITAALERYPGQVQIMDSFNRLARDRSQISQRINEISRNANIPEDSKKDIIKSLRDQQNALMVLANRLYIQNVEKR